MNGTLMGGVTALLLVWGTVSGAVAQEPPSPAQTFGFEPGTDYEVADLDELYGYYRELARTSERVQLREIGESTRGEPLLLLLISSRDNLGRIDRWRGTSELLAGGRLLPRQARNLARESPALVWIDAGLHSTELAPTQHAPVLAHHLATDESEEARRIRDGVVLLLMPVMNPDGHRVVVDWYRENLGTPWETTDPVELYHEYAGHDTNRDWFMIRQQETAHISRALYGEWHPQIVFNHHQEAPYPARIFVPPFADPVNPHIPSLVVRGVNLVGEAIQKRLAERGMEGAVSGTTFTMWWNGGMRTVPYFKNMVGILSEVAHSSPTPEYHPASELPEVFGAPGRTIPAQKPSIHYSDPWRGGWSRFSDAVEYHLQASLATLDIAARFREEWLYNVHQLASRQIDQGMAGSPYAYIVDVEEQWDQGEAAELLRALLRGGVEIHRSRTPFLAEGREYPSGAYVLMAAQPYRPYLMDLLEAQEHPERELFPGGPPEPPYGDLAGWTLPIQMGVEVDRVDGRFHADLERVQEISPPQAASSHAPDAFGFWLSARRNESRQAVNELLDDGLRVFVPYRLPVDEEAERGFLVEASNERDVERVRTVARSLGLHLRPESGSSTEDLREIRRPSVGVYRSWVPEPDEGWTRWLLERYRYPVASLRDPDIRDGGLDQVDVLVLPDQSAETIRDGHEPGSRPPAYVGGLGPEGTEEIRGFVEEGGVLVAMDGATRFVMEELSVPVEDAVAALPRNELFVPGSLLRLQVDGSDPVAWGMPLEAAVFYQRSRAFRVLDPERVRVAARYGASGLLLSGWEQGADEHLAGRPAVVRAPLGEGEVVLVGFRPQFRGQTSGTFKFLFNAILQGSWGEEEVILESGWGNASGEAGTSVGGALSGAPK